MAKACKLAGGRLPSVYSGALRALLTFAALPWYPAYAQTTTAWGRTPLQDQQLGGLLMWVLGGIPYLIAGLALQIQWLRTAEERVRRWESQVLRKRIKPFSSDNPFTSDG
jgi:putative membrane protein